MTAFYRLSLKIQGSEPPIWRRFALNAEARVEDLHRAVRDLGWLGFAGWEMMTPKGGFVAGFDPLADDGLGGGEQARLSRFLRKTGDHILYVYDLEERFVHEIRHEGMMIGPTTAWRFLFDGARNFPPEGCGGIEGHRRLVAALGSDRGGDEESLVAAHGDWRPDRFDLERERERWDRDLGDMAPDDPTGEILESFMEICSRSQEDLARGMAVQNLIRASAARIEDPAGRDTFWCLVGFVSGRDDLGFDLETEEARPRLLLGFRDDGPIAAITTSADAGVAFTIESDLLASDAGADGRPAPDRGRIEVHPDDPPGSLTKLLGRLARLARRTEVHRGPRPRMTERV